MAEHYATPLPDEAIAAFTGLRYYPVDESLSFEALFERFDDTVDIAASTGSVSGYPSAGWVTIPFPHEEVVLRVLRGEDDDLYVPFRDATSGATTYAAGRYALAELQPDGRLVVDFNKATNPHCAYDEEFSCPLPPPENHLAFAVEAGELSFP